MNRTRLSPTQIDERLAHGWQHVHGALQKRFDFADFHRTMAFVNALAWIAHGEDHHPDLSVHFDHCIVRWATHSAGGVTALDFHCAARVDALGPA